MEGLIKKQALILAHYETIGKLKVERGKFNKKISAVEIRLRELLGTEADTQQLSLFDDIDQFLKEMETPDVGKVEEAWLIAQNPIYFLRNKEW